MARIHIVTPAGAGTRTGNRHTAQRWAGLLRELGHRVTVSVDWLGGSCDLLLALHARRSHASIAAFRCQFADRPIAVVLTGTDLYQDLPESRQARESLQLADRVIVLQEHALSLLDSATRSKARVVYQSADPAVRHAPPKGILRVAVVGHLREVKDPFRAALALAHLPPRMPVRVVQVGDAMSPDFARTARQWMAREPRYRWIGGRSHAQALAWIARSHLLVVSSHMEGGANVICEAARIGTPVLASRMSGNLGMLGGAYPGFFPLGDDRALGKLMLKAFEDGKFRVRLKRALAARRPLFAPAAERRALHAAVRDLVGSRR